MSSGNMSSGIISFPSWTPPPLSSLNFGSNCTHARAFLQSWFDLRSYEDIDAMPGSEFNVTFWVPQTLEAQATETYFREALPSDLQAVASYGEILIWERLLRDNYTEALTEFLGLADALNLTGSALHSATDSLPLDIPYYDHVIHAPSRACKQQVCELGFDWDKLGDVNGPGVFIYYICLLAIGVLYSLIALCGALQYRLGHTEPRNSKHTSSRSLLGDLFTTVKLSFSGFSDGAAVFSLALPCAIFYNYVAAGSVRVTSRKDLILELWVLVYALTVSVWFYRVGACIRRVERAKHRAMHHGQPGRQGRKRVLATGVVLSLSALAFLALVIFLGLYHANGDGPVSPFDFEKFWDDFCGYGALSIRDVIIGLSLLVGYCAIRTVISAFIIPCVISRKEQNILGNLNGKQGADMLQRARELHKISKTEPRYRRWADILGVLDVMMLMAGSVVMLWYYYKQREQLSRTIGARSFRDGWTLGQILAVSSLLPVLIGFVHTFVGVRDRRH
ncbi:uncharacterized protein B0H64DRAFT_205164 [Chaetomium fimeti]|uniref:Uncharacterized protein n=1 Tax=Chaetomium fimeti TaxID=1854472 RepID=A0AAE0HAR2_9PEZI|nr:hypothetical protein B0H64DRAFT_205164 [Chaetomium fimeti]